MKKIRILVILIALVAFIPSTSFALLDVGAYGGYSFAGETETVVDTIDTSGWEYGFVGHFNSMVLPMILSVGVGLYYQTTPLSADGITVDTPVGSQSSGDISLTKNQLGLDAYAQLDLPIIPIHPYVKVTYAIYDKYEIEFDKASSWNQENTEWFPVSYAFGAGVAVGIFPMIQVFGEYMYTTSEPEEDVVIKGNSVHLGLRLSI